MARPSYLSGDLTATERIEKAFWELLEETPFSRITVRAISRKAKVNHNTFYRHFDDIESLSRKAFENVVRKNIPFELLANKESGDNPLSTLHVGDIHKALLYAQSDSALLTNIVRNSIEEAWLNAAGVSRQSLTPGQRMDCDIIFGGIIAAMADDSLDFGDDIMESVMNRPIGRAMLETLNEISDTKMSPS